MASNEETREETGGPVDFIRAIVAEDLASGKHGGKVATRFPPEPNGYLHIGHAKAICLNFGIALENEGATCNLRFDDTNPAKEEVEYVDSIMEDVRWLGFDWGDRLFYASDYFEQLYRFAEELIQSGHAFVCGLTAEEMREYRGTLTEPGKNSPYRDRPPEESLDLFRRMRAGEFKEGEYTLRAKIDMASPNITMRDPALYRIKKAHPGVRRPEAAVRLGAGARQRPLPAPADRVRPAEPELHRIEQAEAAAAGAGKEGVRMGRPADADPLRDAPPGDPAGGDSEFL